MVDGKTVFLLQDYHFKRSNANVDLFIKNASDNYSTNSKLKVKNKP